jgi:ethanolamine utilization protein EutQ (cupin superfamily)
VENSEQNINLKETAEIVINGVNKSILNSEHHFHFNNHDTLSDKTKHSEQRKSATFYGLTKVNIPSFGVEVSRNIKSETLKKTMIQKIIFEFMNYYDIQIQAPIVFEPQPILNYILVKINDEKRFVEPGDKIIIPINAKLQIVDVSTNYKRGNYINLLGFGNKNDLNKTFVINRNTEINVFKDYINICSIPVILENNVTSDFQGFRVYNIDEKSYHNINISDTLKVTEGVEFEIVGPLNNESDISITVAGALLKKQIDGKNVVDTGFGLNDKFKVNKEKNIYEILIFKNNKKIGCAYLQIMPIIPSALHITHNGKSMVLAPGDTLFTNINDTIFISDVELNGLNSDKVKVNFAGYIVNPLKEAEDRNGNIILNNSGLIPKFAVNKEKNIFEIHVLYKQKKHATYSVYINDY